MSHWDDDFTVDFLIKMDPYGPIELNMILYQVSMRLCERCFFLDLKGMLFALAVLTSNIQAELANSARSLHVGYLRWSIAAMSERATFQLKIMTAPETCEGFRDRLCLPVFTGAWIALALTLWCFLWRYVKFGTTKAAQAAFEASQAGQLFLASWSAFMPVADCSNVFRGSHDFTERWCIMHYIDLYWILYWLYIYVHMYIWVVNYPYGIDSLIRWSFFNFYSNFIVFLHNVRHFVAKDGVALKAEWRMAPARHCWASSLWLVVGGLSMINCSSITVYQYHVHHDHIRILLVMTLMFMYYNNSYSYPYCDYYCHYSKSLWLGFLS